MDEIQLIQNKIYEIRGQRVMLDFDLAAMYGVETRALNQAVKRNIERFPEDFMFQITAEEWYIISSQFVMTSRSKRPKSALPLAFTEHGALMLASVLRSDIAIDMSVKITRAFVAMRTILTNPSLPSKLQELAEDVKALREEVNSILEDQNDINEDTRMQLELINESLAALQTNYRPPRRPIVGFNVPEDKA
ncbi:MAG: ORF6N domain-containing protein [Bacteroidaceae bacterium]|nr:ORF6N domain-containing protein [Bacteroidaceae bacterium]